MSLEEIYAKVENFLVEDMEIDAEKINGDALLVKDLGIDSLEVVDIVVYVDDEFGYKMKPEDFKQLHTVNDFCNFIKEHIA